MPDRFIEFRLYKLKPGTRDKFHAIALEAREKALAGFYGSEEWAKRFNDTVVGMIESYNTIVLESSDPAIRTIAKIAG